MIIDTTLIDTMALSLRDTVRHANTIDIMETTSTMKDLLEMEARATILGGVAVYTCIAVGLNNADQIKPSRIFSNGEATFVGKLVGLEMVDFTAAIERDETTRGTLRPGESLVTHGLVFEVDENLEQFFEGNLGVASLMPYVAVLPGSLYTVTRLSLV